MRTKISKVAKDLNVAVSTALDFLKKHNIEVEGGLNARIDDDAVNLLYKEFSKDKDAKAEAEQYLTTRREEKKDREEKREEKRNQRVETPAGEPHAGLKIKRKIDLDNLGSPRAAVSAGKPEPKPEAKAEEKPVETPKAPEAPAPQTPKPAEAAAAPKPEAQEAPKPQPKAEPERPAEQARPVAEPKPEVKKEEKKPEAPKPAPQPAPVRKEEAPAPKPAPAEAPAKEAAAPQVKAPESTEPFRAPGSTPAAPGLKVVGKIDLSAINSATRPKKKSRAERKRKRIGQEKVNVEKAASQPGFGSDKRKDQGQGRGDQPRVAGQERGGRRRRGGNGGGNPYAAPKQEVSNEDVQKQVKETLARLTTKKTNKSVKFRKERREEMHNRELANAEREAAESKVLKITEFVTANDLASLMDIPVNKVIATCMNLGVMVSINQRLDAETINIVAEEFGFETEFVSADVTEAIEHVEDKEEELQSRPPIVTVMGHVDHGKTSLLDYIRKANVIAGEAGGITQHIGAYNVKLNDGRHITFLDTPGHEAFTAMRARGAKVTDLAIIIVAADDDVMPQTIEAINHASAAGVPMVFAINKIDKPAANPDKIKEELANMNYLVEEWGGKYQSQDISAKKGIGVDELMEKVLLEAEMLDLKANPDRAAIGSVIESSLDKGRGYVATVLVQNGTLRVGDVILAGTNFGKVKAMFNERNQRVKEAGPATPVQVLGLNGAPTAGDTFNVMPTEQEAREIATKREQLQRELGLRTKKRLGLEELGRRRALNDFHELNLVVKGDVDGSIEAISDALLKLSTPEVQVNVLHKGVGAISESDVTLAAASDAIIIGFQVRPSANARKEAEREGVEIRLYSVIYKAIEEVKDAMEGMLSPEIKEEITGTAEVLQTYHISKVGTIAGALVRDGKIKRTSKVRVIRDGIVIYTGELGSLKRFKDDAKEVVSGYDCGLSVQGYNDIREGDLIEAYEEVEVKKTLK